MTSNTMICDLNIVNSGQSLGLTHRVNKLNALRVFYQASYFFFVNASHANIITNNIFGYFHKLLNQLEYVSGPSIVSCGNESCISENCNAIYFQNIREMM